MIEYGFTENIDFVAITQKRVTAQGNETLTFDHIMKIPMAKSISMLQRNEKGKIARNYFIKCEEAWNDDDMILARAYQIQNKKIIGYTEQIIVLESKIEEQRPQVLFAKAVETSKASILVGEQAKILNQNGINLGQNRLFAWLRTNGFLISRKGSDWNMPTQKSMNLGLFEIKETVQQQPNGSVKVTKTPKVTGKVQLYFVNKFLGGA